MINASRRRFVASMAAAPAILAAPSLVRAQSGKPLTIFLTVPPGTSSDTLARMLGTRLSAKLNRPVVVESRSGAGGLVAIQALRSLDADGSTLMMAPNSAVSLLPLFSSKPTFDLDRDLLPVVECASAPTAFTVNPASGVNSMAEYFESVRKSPKQGSIGVPSPVSMGALVIYQLGKQLNLPLQAVPYRGGAPLLADLLGNQVPCSGSILPDYLEMHRAGKLKILAHCSDKRSPLAPEIPTLAEAGYPGYVAVTSFGLYAKAGQHRCRLFRHRHRGAGQRARDGVAAPDGPGAGRRHAGRVPSQGAGRPCPLGADHQGIRNPDGFING
jgi:tripartite-type tricarboxylate transporter receptor subunit TctC